MTSKLIAGLGNPSPEYEATYHNVGMLAVNYLAKGAEFKAHKGLFRYATAGDVAFVLPLTFMNDSGGAVKEAIKKFGVKPGGLVVIHDESDITIGNYKMSAGRNAAGHKGVQSIFDALKTKEFLRARIGIRSANEKKREKASAFVLKKITKKDRELLLAVFGAIGKELLLPALP